LWLGIIALVIASLCGKERLLAVLKRRDVLVWAAVVSVATGLALIWTRTVGVSVLGNPGLSSWSRPHIAAVVLGQTGTYVRQMVGVFSFDNVPAPLFTFVIWWTLVSLLVLLAVAVARLRQLLVLIGLVVATIFIPVAIDVLESQKVGYLWQGRYSLPLAIGIPLLAAFIIGRRLPGLEHRRRRLATTVVAAIAVAHIGAFIWVLRHFMWGQGQWSFLHSQWEPPVPGIVLVIAFAAVTTAYAWWLRAHLAGTRAPVTTSEDVRPNSLDTGIDTLRA
jgi:hypothetical protein